MRKFLYFSLSCAGALILAVLLIWWNLPTLGAYALGKIAGGPVQISKMDFSYRNGVLVVEMADVDVKGKIRGSARRWSMALNLRKGVYLNNIALSDFDLTIPEEKDGKSYHMVPVEHLEAKNGVVTYGSQSFFIRKLLLDDLNTDKQFRFQVDVSNKEMFGDLKADGQGTFKDKPIDLKGRISVSRVDMRKHMDNMGGLVKGEGSFVYDKKGFSFDGLFAASRYELKLDALKTPLYADALKGRVLVAYGEDKTDVRVRDVIFEGTSFSVDVYLHGDNVAAVDLSSGVLDLSLVRHFVDLEQMARGLSGVWNYIRDGKLAIKKLAYRPDRAMDVEVEVTDTRAVYEDTEFDEIEAFLRSSKKIIDVSGAKGRFGQSVFHDVSATIDPLRGRLSAQGAYSIDLRDISSRLSTNDMAVKGGVSFGTVSLKAQGRDRIEFHGKGSVENGDIAWRGIPLSAKGSYHFANDSLTFDSFSISGDGTDMSVTGTWSPQLLNLSLGGSLDIAHVRQVLPIPFEVNGIALVDADIEQNDSVLGVRGTAALDNVFYEIPRFMKKGKGIRNAVEFDVSKRERGIHAERLIYSLDGMNMDVTGDIKTNGKMDLDGTVKIDGFEKMAKVFLLPQDEAKGDGEAVMSFRDVDLKTREIPYMKGHVRISNGFLRLPWITKPFKEVSLTSEFKGDEFDVRVDRLVCGESVVKKGSLSVKDFKSPRFSLSLDVDTFNPGDFEGEGEFKSLSISGDSLLRRASGDLAVRVRSATLGDAEGEHLVMNGVLKEGTLTISELKVDILGGLADIHGTADFSGPTPNFYASGRVDKITSGEAVKAFDGDTEIIDSRGLLLGSLSARGETPSDWLETLSGNVTLYSQGGVIRKWKLLSRIFGLLNVYDLFRGKVDLKNEGLSYTKMGAAFVVKDGVFKTDNFLIDSPSMVITGSGDLDFKKMVVAGQVRVAPLVTLDTVISYVPIIRTILKKKGGGFLYVGYDVSGPLNDPEVRVSFTETVAAKTLDLLKNIITLPIGVLE